MVGTGTLGNQRIEIKKKKRDRDNQYSEKGEGRKLLLGATGDLTDHLKKNCRGEEESNDTKGEKGEVGQEKLQEKPRSDKKQNTKKKKDYEIDTKERE